MPRNEQGVYRLPPGNPVVSDTLITTTWANPTMSDLGNEITNSLPRSGVAPMTGPLILNGNAVGQYEAVALGQVVTIFDEQFENEYKPQFEEYVTACETSEANCAESEINTANCAQAAYNSAVTAGESEGNAADSAQDASDDADRAEAAADSIDLNIGITDTPDWVFDAELGCLADVSRASAQGYIAPSGNLEMMGANQLLATKATGGKVFEIYGAGENLLPSVNDLTSAGWAGTNVVTPFTGNFVEETTETDQHFLRTNTNNLDYVLGEPTTISMIVDLSFGRGLYSTSGNKAGAHLQIDENGQVLSVAEVGFLRGCFSWWP